MTTRVTLDYGSGQLTIGIPAPAQVTILDKARATPTRDRERSPTDDIEDALEHPIDAAPLAELAQDRTDAVIVVSDSTRPVPNRRLLPPVLETLQRAGIPRERIRLLVATGLHRAASAEELRELLGAEIPEAYTVWQHDAHDTSMHRSLGTSRHGIPIEIDRRYLDADLRVITGLIEPHLMAGYSGGRKAVCPGLASTAAIRVAHSARMLESKLGPGLLMGNPLHEDLTRIARLAGVDFMLNVSLDRDRNISGVFAGDLERAFEAGASFVERESMLTLNEPCDLVLVSGGGHPLDATFYQAIKGIVAAASIVREGGIILLCAALSEGIGGAEFTELLLGCEGPEGFERQLEQRTFVGVDQWMIQHLCQAWRRAEVWLYTTGVSEELAARMLVRPVSSPEQALEAAIRQLGSHPRIAVLPQGPYVLATVQGVKRPVGRGVELRPTGASGG